MHHDYKGDHDSHKKVMWLMMLICALPILFILFSAAKTRFFAILFLAACCIDGHFLLMKLLGHSGHTNKDKPDKE